MSLLPSMMSATEYARDEARLAKRVSVAGSPAASPGRPLFATEGACVVYRPARSFRSSSGYCCENGTWTAGWNRELMMAALGAIEFCPSSPYVMLSPNARNDVVESFGGLVTVTVNAHVSVRCSASVTVHVTIFWPSVKGDPADGEHAVATGVCPNVTVGAV